MAAIFQNPKNIGLSLDTDLSYYKVSFKSALKRSQTRPDKILGRIIIIIIIIRNRAKTICPLHLRGRGHNNNNQLKQFEFEIIATFFINS